MEVCTYFESKIENKKTLTVKESYEGMKFLHINVKRKDLLGKSSSKSQLSYFDTCNTVNVRKGQK